MTVSTQSGARSAALGALLVLLSGASVSAYAPSEPGAGLLEGETDGGHSRSRRLLVTPVLQELLNGANGRYVSANDEMFRVMRRNKCVLNASMPERFAVYHLADSSAQNTSADGMPPRIAANPIRLPACEGRLQSSTTSSQTTFVDYA